jgi:hypothetical protein
MSCATKTYASNIVGMQKSDGPGLTADQCKSKKHQSRVEPRVMADCSHTDPEYVWGDEGPIND